MNAQTTKLEHKIIAGWINSRASILDLGCGDGALLSLLINCLLYTSDAADE